MKLGALVGESEFTIRMLERGVVPDNYHLLIKKLEEVLETDLFTEEYKKMHAEATLTIQDLKEINTTEELPEEPYWRKVMNKMFSRRTKKEEMGDNSVRIEEEKQIEEDLHTSQEEKVLDLTQTHIEEDSSPQEKKNLSPEEINALIFGSKK
jgi:hypothetical protein